MRVFLPDGCGGCRFACVPTEGTAKFRCKNKNPDTIYDHVVGRWTCNSFTNHVEVEKPHPRFVMSLRELQLR